ncbi:hypothetical protein D3C72_1756750 [compost metagenome]
MSRHQGLHDHTLADIHAKGSTRPSLGRLEHPRTIPQSELPRRRQSLKHASAHRHPIDLQGQGKADLDTLAVERRARRQPVLDRLADEHVAPPEKAADPPEPDNSSQVIKSPIFIG